MTLQKASQWDVKLASKMQGYKSLFSSDATATSPADDILIGKGKLATTWLHGSRLVGKINFPRNGLKLKVTTP